MATVLVVDDEANVRLTLAIALRRFGHEVAVAPDAEAALDVLHEREFEWIVSDVRMPGMSGVELATLLSREGNTPRIVLTSAYSDINTPCSVVAFFQKPVDTRQLSDFLNTPPQTAELSPPSPVGTPPGSVLIQEVSACTPVPKGQVSLRPTPFNWASRCEVSQAVKDAMEAIALRRAQSALGGSSLPERGTPQSVL